MLNSTRINTEHFLVALFCIFLTCFSDISAQSEQDSLFKVKVSSILKSKPKHYSVLDSLLRRQQKDSLKMQFLAKESSKNNYPLGQGYALNSLGIVQRDISNYQSAISLHKQAERLAQLANDIELQAVALNMIGVAYRRMDVVKPALDYHTQALNLAKSVENRSKNLKRSIAVSQNSMGNIYLTLKQYDLALKQFNKSLIIESEENSKLGLAINYQNIGYAHEAKGDFDKALTNYNLSLDYNNQINSDLGRVICFNSIGQVYIKQERHKEAKVLIEEGLKKALNLGDQYYIATSYNNLGWVEMALNELDSAKKHLKLGLKTATDFNLKSFVVEANKLLSELYSKENDYKNAMFYYKDAIALEHTITDSRNLQYINDISIAHENEVRSKQIQALADETEAYRLEMEQNKKLFWFILLGLAVLAAAIIAYNRHQQLQQEKLILTLEQDMLRSQMNPHFIFNSLNSIKLYIINNEKENAVYYLNKFAKLIRKILVASSEKEISLEEELETMQLYMNIENIRFSNEIDFEITKDDHVHPALIKVPSLILQPFLENALWHGLSTKKEDKKINLHVSKVNEDFVIISITDNGVGRKESARIKKGKLLKRKSIGINLTKARLANFSKDYLGDYQIDIKDLYDEDGNAKGTKVIVSIPINELTLKTA